MVCSLIKQGVSYTGTVASSVTPLLAQIAVACDDGLLLITHHTMILVIIAVLMTDTINTLTRTTDTVVTAVREY